MPTSADGEWAVDTSVAVAYLDATHVAHSASVDAIGDRRLALAGHAAFETYAVLTRLPGPSRVRATDAATALAVAFPDPCRLSPDEQASLLERLAPIGIRGGAVYDALVGEAARVRGRTLITRDRRATRSYDLLGTHYELL